MDDSVTVNELLLPTLLVDLISTGRWVAPEDERAFDSVFAEYAGVTFYSIDQMKRETEWSHSFACEGSYMRGVVDRHQPPGDIDPSQAVLIGDAGIGFDSPLALDYRVSRGEPCVIAFHWYEKRWRRVALSFPLFAEAFQL